MVAVFANTSLTIMTIHNIHPIMIIREMSEQFYLVLFPSSKGLWRLNPPLTKANYLAKAASHTTLLLLRVFLLPFDIIDGPLTSKILSKSSTRLLLESWRKCRCFLIGVKYEEKSKCSWYYSYSDDVPWGLAIFQGSGKKSWLRLLLTSSWGLEAYTQKSIVCLDGYLLFTQVSQRSSPLPVPPPSFV